MIDVMTGMIYCHTIMSSAKVAITLEQELLVKLDQLVKGKQFPNRSKAIQIAVMEKLQRMEKSHLAIECSKLDPSEEQSMAEEGIQTDSASWPVY